MKKYIVILASTALFLGGCTLPTWLGGKDQTWVTTTPEASASPYTMQASPNPSTSPETTEKQSSEVKDMEKDLNTIKIESDFDAMVK